MPRPPLPYVIADTPLDEVVQQLLDGNVQVLPWQAAVEGATEPVCGIYTFGHLPVDGPMMDRFPGLQVISNYGVGVDHIDVPAANLRGIPVGNTPGVLDGATADMAMALLLSAARRVVEGDRYARGPEFMHYDPSYMLGREVHGSTLGIIGMGRIGRQVARRAAGFEMAVLYHNRRRREEAEAETGATYASKDELLERADYVVLTVPLTDETVGLIGERELARMKSTATLINVARGPVVDTQALVAALRDRRIYAAALDVTDPEPLPRNHPLLALDNLTIVPHLGSATRQTRQAMAEVSVQNLMEGLAGRPLIHAVNLD